MKPIVAAALLMLAACSSTPKDGVSKESGGASLPVEVALVQISPPSAGSTYFAGPTSVDLQLRIINRSEQPVKLRRVELASQGLGAYSITPYSRVFDDVIPAGKGRKVDLWVRGYARGSDLNAPVTIRANIMFDTPLGPLRRLVLQEVEYDFSNAR